MKLKKSLTDFFSLQKEIHGYFGYQEDWVTIPLQDNTEFYWSLRERDIRYHETPLTKEFIEGGGHYSAIVYRQRFLTKWVYRTDDYTMICADTQTDGNKYLMVFDNQKECKGLENCTFTGW
jgi:hypothetical protein